MMQSGILLPSWPYQENMISIFQERYDNLEFSPSLMTFEDEDFQFSDLGDSLQVTIGGFPELEMEEFVDYKVEELRKLLEGEENQSNPSEQFNSSSGEYFWNSTPSMVSSETTTTESTQTPLTMEIDKERSILHLLEAYGEASENNQEELAGVILRRLGQKSNPAGKNWERIAFNLSKNLQNHQIDYLKQESMKNFEAAFKAFYLMFPFGKFAHLAANSVILEAIPEEAGGLHIIDFDIGAGVQWPPVIEAMAEKHKLVRITSSIRKEEENSDPSPWSFEEVRRQLIHHARFFRLELRVGEMDLEELVAELKKRGAGSGREFLAFNCTAALPHTGKSKSQKLVREFLTIAKGLLAKSGGCNSKGIVVFGDGGVSEKLKNCYGFGAFFDGYLSHYQAILESMEIYLPEQLKEARIAMESLFLASNISTDVLLQKWEEMKEDRHFQEGMGMDGVRISREIEIEAKELVKEGGSSFAVRNAGDSGNEIVLDWRGNPLIRVSAWRNRS